MDSCEDLYEHESCAKRIKLEPSLSNVGVFSAGDGFSKFSTTTEARIDPSEGVTIDSDSAYASMDHTPPTPSRTPPHLSSDVHETYSSLSQTPTYTTTDNLDVSQDSMLEGDDDNASTVSHLSDLSGLSDISGHNWKPMADSVAWIQKQISKGTDPKALLLDLGIDLSDIPQFVDDMTLWKFIINMMEVPPARHKLRHVNNLDDVVRLLKGAQNIIVLTGAGVSVSCGIPDFRSRDGIYSRLAIDFPDLPDPQAMFDISYFSQDPRPFFKFAKDIYPGKFQPSPCHRFIKLLERQGKLLRNYTQNIDTLEKVADINNVIECHGSFATATCTKCSHKVTAEEIREIVLTQNIPVCTRCNPNVGPSISMDELRGREAGQLRDLVAAGIMKPDIVFFGEGLPDSFHEAMGEDKTQCDLLLVIGSSLKVRPVALIPSSLPASVPQILINRESLGHCVFDVELLGDCDVIINHLCQLMGSSWEDGINDKRLLKETIHLLPWPIEETNEDNQTPASTETETSSECKCNNSTKSTSSFSPPLESDLGSINCKCKSAKELLSITENSCNSTQLLESDCNSYLGKERHMSIDSAKDSGIGENSNFTDTENSKFDLISEDNQGVSQSSEERLEQSSNFDEEPTSMTDMRGYWQPKQKRSLTERLPPDTFYLMAPSRYIFPGAEYYIDPDEKCNYFDNSSSDSSDSESETENEAPDNSF